MAFIKKVINTKSLSTKQNIYKKYIMKREEECNEGRK